MKYSSNSLIFNESSPFSLSKPEKKILFLDELQQLNSYHQSACSGYQSFVTGLDFECKSLESIPYVPVRLFKDYDLYSVEKEDIFKTLNSSGTTGSVSKIYIDRETSKLQTKILGEITKFFIGNVRRPMIIIDSLELLKDRTKFNARAAGILGYSVFGKQHFYALDENLNLKVDELNEFLEDNRDDGVLIFSFTFIMWQKMLEFCRQTELFFDFGENSILIHGGGWKKLVDLNISNDVFKDALKNQFNISRIHNYYGMIEQVGSVFMECQSGFLHCSNYSDIVVRDKLTFEPVKIGNEGVLQVLSLLPHSYPGFSLLTEDIAIQYGEDDCSCGLNGKYFKVNGRLPQAELRGCSDTRVV